MNPQRDMVQSHVPWSDLWGELLALSAAFLIPILLLVFDLADRTADLFQRSGTLTLLIVAVLEFKFLSDVNRKHLYNDLRIKDNEQIQDISKARQSLGWFSLVAAIYGAAISAFGDKFVKALIKLLF